MTTAMCALSVPWPGSRGGRAGWLARAGRVAGTPGARDAPRRLPGRSRTGRHAPPRGDGLRAREVGRTCRPHDQGTRPDRAPAESVAGPGVGGPCARARLPVWTRPRRRHPPGRRSCGSGRGSGPRSLASGRAVGQPAGRRRCGRPHGLRHDERPGGQHGSDQPGPGLPRHGRPREPARGRGRGDPRRRQPVPARSRHPRAAPGGRRAPGPLLRHRARPRHRGAGHGRGDGGPRRRRPRLLRPRRRGRGPGAVLRRLRGRDRARRGGAPHGSADASRSTPSSPAPSPPPSGPAPA